MYSPLRKYILDAYYHSLPEFAECSHTMRQYTTSSRLTTRYALKGKQLLTLKSVFVYSMVVFVQIAAALAALAAVWLICVGVVIGIVKVGAWLAKLNKGKTFVHSTSD